MLHWSLDKQLQVLYYLFSCDSLILDSAWFNVQSQITDYSDPSKFADARSIILFIIIMYI